MATGYQGISDTPQSFNTSVGSPDFGFLQQNLYRSNQQYEQGLSQIKQDYSVITSAPLTNGENIDKRNEYVAQIQEGLKKVAPTDVSLPQNVQQAENLYAPFWKDSELLQDMSKTKSIQNEFQKAESARTSDKDEIRSTFDQASLGPLNTARNQLSNAKRGDGSIAKVNVPQWTPFINLDKDVSDWKEKDKPEVSWTDNYYTKPDGSQGYDPTHEYTHSNGPKTLNAWTTMVSRQIGDRANPQFNVLGSNLYNSELDNYMQANPNADKGVAQQAVLGKYFQPIMDEKKTILDRYTAELSDKQSRLDTLIKAQSTHPNGLTKKQIAIQNGLQSEISTLQNEISPIKTSYNNFSKVLSQQSPTDSYVIDQLSGLLKDRSIQSYAQGFAAETNDKVTTNQAYFDQQNHNDRIAELTELHNYHKEEISNQKEKNSLEYLKIQGDYPELFGAQTGKPVIAGSTIGGAATNDLEHLTVAEQWLRSKEIQRNSVGNNLFAIPNVQGADKYGPFSQILMNPEIGATSQELAAFNRIQLANQNGNLNYTTDGKFIPASEQDGQLYNSIVSKLERALGENVVVGNTPDKVTKMLIDYGKNYVSKSAADGTSLDASKYYTNLYNTTSRVYNDLDADLTAHKQMMTNEVAKYPQGYSDIAVKNPDGGYHMIGQKDISPFSFDMSVRGEDGKEYHYSKADLTQKYLHGQVEVVRPSGNESGTEASPYIKIDGQEVHPLNIAGRDYQHEYEMQHPTGIGKWWAAEGVIGAARVNPDAKYDAINRIEHITHQFGKSSDIAEGMKNLSESVIPHAEWYKQGTGKVPTMINIPITGKKFEDNTGYLSDALQPGNRIGVEDANGEPVNKTEEIDALSHLSNDPKQAGYIGKTQRVIVDDRYGIPKMVVSVGKIADESDPYHVLSGKTYYINVSPDTKSEMLKKFPIAQDREMYDPLYSGNPDEAIVHSPVMAKAFGNINATLTRSPGNNGFIIQGGYNDIDPATGKSVPASIYIPIEAGKTATQARAMLDQTVNTLVNRYHTHLTSFNTKNGVNVQ